MKTGTFKIGSSSFRVMQCEFGKVVLQVKFFSGHGPYGRYKLLLNGREVAFPNLAAAQAAAKSYAEAR